MSIEELETIRSYFSEQHSDIQKIYSLTPMQAGIHFHYLENKSSFIYFVQLVYTIQGNLQIDYLEKSLNHVINKYDDLRTNIIYHKLREPLQIVLKERHTTIHFEDISTLHKHKQEKYIENFTTSDKEKGFDLSRDCLIRMSLLQTDDHEYRLILSFHHIIIDGWCYPILWDDLLRAYLSFMERTPVGEEYALPYYEYIRWLNNQNIQGGLDYWKKYLSGLEEKTLLPGMEKGTSQQYCAQELTVSINSETKKRLQEIASQHQTTLNVLFQVLWGMVLHRYTGKDDVVFGVVVSGRPAELEDVEKMVGIFINTMPIRINNNDCQIFTELLQHIGRETIESQKYAYVGLSAIQQQSIFQRELINHVIAFENYPLPEQMAEKETINRTGFHVEIQKIYEQPNYDFFLQLFPTEKLIIKCIFNSKLYNKKIVQNLIDYCVYLADLVCQVPDLSLHDERLFQLLPQEQQLIENINQTYRVFAAHKTIHQLFEEQVVKTPNALAVLSQGKQLTYQELNQRANRVASLLRKKGVKPNTVVALLVSRSEDMVIGLLSILKAGGAYLPLDPDFPQERISLMLERSKVSLLLVNSTLHAPSSYLGEILHLNDVVFDPENGTNPESMNSSEDLAYILFTSGSTGIPKGVMISHRAVNNFIKGVTDVIPFRNQNRIVALTTISFDIFVLETFLPLNKGATVVLADETQQKNIQKLGQLIVNQKVDRLQITPSRLQILLQNSECRTILEHIESIMVGGEAFPRQLLEKLKRVYKGRIFNMYGPTETTVWSSIKELTDSDYIDIGKPIANTQIYILNESHQLQPIGTAGELCIAGDGLSSGYLYDPEMTSSRFVPCPFKAEEKMYKTGDLARILPDGAIEFLGRMDYQVKVRGYRIESGEIEDAIAHFPGIQESVVITKKDPLDNTVLAAYYIAQTKLDTSEIQAFLSKKLPDYMVPSIFVHLYKFPLTPNGKIDRKALPELDKDTISISSIYSPPTTGLQGQLVSICKEILMNVKIGINDNFFQLGLNSLSVVTFHSKIEEFYPGKVMVTDFFAYPNISKLASYIEGKTSESIKQLSIKPLCLPHRYFRDSQNTNGEEHSLFTFD
ncbi:MAG: amino acid adenylation domain-containing protein, partial [Patescibacteria group bacterium]|nr:amino acid adenylation domain-containing protein [Patescibacteria group bacterium]